MATIGVKIKIMPKSPETNLEDIKEKTKEIIEKKQGKIMEIEENPIAFGLKAIIVLFTWPEEKELETIENSLSNLEEVNSVQVIDMRRAVG